MSKDVLYSQYSDQILEILTKGAFLTTSHNGKVNTMTIGWGSVSRIWQKPIFLVLVRYSRFTYELIEKSTEFTVSIPLKDMQAALTLCGTKSGRDIDKIAAAGLSTVPGKKVSVPVIASCGLHYECKIVYKQAMAPDLLDSEYQKACYPNGDYHTLYFGEIVATYVDE